MQLITWLLVIATFGFHDIVPVYRNKQWKVFGTYVAIMFLLIFVLILKSFNIAIPSPTLLITKLVTLVTGQHQE